VDATTGVVDVFTEAGTRYVFASALDWPGWARRAKTEQLALEALADYLPRYAVITALASLEPPAGPLVVAERHAQPVASADFGALGPVADLDRRPLDAASGARLAALLEAGWSAFDQTAAAAPRQLRKGPRGGGRDTGQIVAHVAEAEAIYARKLGIALTKDEKASADVTARCRRLIAAALREPSGLVTPDGGWPPRYAARRICWHVLDHLWEIEDKSEPG
jgi:hypothetical protein